MSKKYIPPDPTYKLEAYFTKYNRKYKVDIIFFKDNTTFLNYYNSSTVNANYHAIAGAIFEDPVKSNKYLVGTIAFDLSSLSPAIIAHEVVHICFNWFERVRDSDLVFKGRRKEETFCGILQEVMDQIFRFMKNQKISYHETTPFDE